MHDKSRRSRRKSPAIVVSGLLLAVSAAYVAGYFAASTIVQGGPLLRGRLFPAKWGCTMYCPVVRIEAATRGETLVLYYQDRGGLLHVFDYEPHRSK